MCANCSISLRSCQYTIPARRPGPRVPKQRRPPERIVPPTERSVVLVRANTLRRIAEHLSATLSVKLPSMSMPDIVGICVNLFLQYLFPVYPVIQEASLRTWAAALFSERGPSAVDKDGEVFENARAFSHITAVCAVVASAVPETELPCRLAIIEPFLCASRDCLKQIQDHDLEHPDSTTLTTRMFHSAALQNTTGRPEVSWDCHGQAALVAARMRLFSEEVIRGREPQQGQLLRNSFWLLYMADKAATALDNRPIVLHELLLHGKLTLQPYGDEFVSLLDSRMPTYGESFEERLLVGFHLLRRFWTLGANIVWEMRTNGAGAKRRIAESYLDFTDAMGSFPAWLQEASLILSDQDDAGLRFRKRSFSVQRYCLLSDYHCLRVVILQECDENNLLSVLGLPSDELAVALKKTEAVHDFLHVLEDTALIYLLVQGEVNVGLMHFSWPPTGCLIA